MKLNKILENKFGIVKTIPYLCYSLNNTTMDLQQTVSKILDREVSLEEAMQFANEQYGTLCQFNREQDEKVNPKKEKRVYLINLDEVEFDKGYHSLTDEEFIKISESQGLVYSLNGFQAQFNQNEINQFNTVIRFI